MLNKLELNLGRKRKPLIEIIWGNHPLKMVYSAFRTDERKYLCTQHMIMEFATIRYGGGHLGGTIILQKK